MIKPIDGFIVPTDEEVRIWRYQSFAKFVWTIEHEALFFSRADLLGDPFEGTQTRSTRNAQLSSAEEAHGDNARYYMQQAALRAAKLRRYVAVNCWHMSEYESAGMWSLYAKHQDGIAIQSTHARLRASLDEAPQTIHLGLVTYVDFAEDRPELPSWLSSFVLKRKSFEHERELRAVIPPPAEPVSDLSRWVPEKDWPGLREGGTSVSVNVRQLIENVYVAPTASRWFADTVRRFATRCGLADRVLQSELQRTPLY